MVQTFRKSLENST